MSILLETTFNTENFQATYSPEDDKLRLYCDEWLDKEIYTALKENGFSWAPKQNLIYTYWTPTREDICLHIASEITPEQTTLIERAEERADRFDDYRLKRLDDANSFALAANRISERFSGGQPILIGHHSERKARRDQASMDSQLRASVKATKTAEYWDYRISGVEAHANHKSNVRTRFNRIKKLLAELRMHQRSINAANFNSPEQDAMTTYPKRARCIQHLLNRLGYERNELGEITLYTGELTKVILQLFARTHGADQPKAILNDDQTWTITSSVCLPLHIAESSALTLTPEKWCELMKNSGYDVPAPTERAKPRRSSTVSLINPTLEQAQKLQDLWNTQMEEKIKKQGYGTITLAQVKEVSQKAYSYNSGGSYSVVYTIELDENGKEIRAYWKNKEYKKHEIPVCRIRVFSGDFACNKAKSVIHITDKAAKNLPINY